MSGFLWTVNIFYKEYDFDWVYTEESDKLATKTGWIWIRFFFDSDV